MTDRRRFLQASAVLASGLPLSWAWGASETSRHALVIGNGAYRSVPLDNPPNDARAMSTLLTNTGFSVDTLINADFATMRAAMQSLAERSRSGASQQLLFYYAGHGAQLDWRNYLLPTDVAIEHRDQVKARCIDLNEMLGQFRGGSDKSFVIILDACRDDPFGGAFRPERKGLSQFDAPVGSLLAYATAPGRTASDGGGKNGLYTEHLLRELAAPNVSLEDALKRVRVNVRLASGGEQVPWESTSLEQSIFFGSAPRKLSADEIEAAFLQELEHWDKIKQSNTMADWAAYLRTYPNGRFAEIAHARLAQLLVPAQTVAPAPVSGPAPASPPALKPETKPAAHPAPVKKNAPAQTEASRIVLPAGGVQGATTPPRAALIINPDNPYRADETKANPFSAGFFEVNQQYTVGDEAHFKKTDLLTNLETGSQHLRVTRVNVSGNQIEFNRGKIVTDLLGNQMKTPEREFRSPLQRIPATLQVGKKWKAATDLVMQGQESSSYWEFEIAAREKTTVPAGTFDAFRIEGLGWNDTKGTRMELRLWVYPGLIVPIRREQVFQKRKSNRLGITERLELVSLHQQAWRAPDA